MERDGRARPRGGGWVALRGRQAAGDDRRPAGPPARPGCAGRGRGGGVVVVLGPTPSGSRPRSPGAARDACREPGSGTRPVELAAGRVRGHRGEPSGPRRARRPAARLRRRSIRALLDAPVEARPAGRRPGLPGDRAGTRSSSAGPRSAWSPRRAAIAGSARSSTRTRNSSARSPVAGANPDVDTPADLGRVDRGGLGRRASGPTASRSSGSARSPTARISTRRSHRSSGPTRPGPTIRSWTRCCDWSGRARRGSTSGPARAASRCRSRARSIRRAAASSRSIRRARCSRGCSRSPRTTPSRTSGRRGPLAARGPRAAADFEADVALIAHVGYDIEDDRAVRGCVSRPRPTGCASRC